MKYYCDCGERFIRKHNYDSHIKICKDKNKKTEDKNYWEHVEKSNWISNDIELEKSLFHFFKNENLKKIYDYGDIMKKYANNFIKTNSDFINSNYLFDWILNLNYNFENLNLTKLHSSNKYGIILSGNIINLDLIGKIKNLGYICDEEAGYKLSEQSKLFKKIVVFRKIKLYNHKNKNLIIVYNKPECLNKKIDVSSYDTYQKYFLNELAGIYNKNKKPLNKKSIMIDIGANIGLSSSPILSLGHIVYCFEPEKINLQILKKLKLINNYNNMIIEDKILYDYDGEISFYSNINREDNSSINKECCGKNVCPLGIIEKKYPCMKLDTWYKNNINNINVEDIKLIKIDTQGAEIDILKGAKNLLIECSKFNKCNIEIECDEKFFKIREITFDNICDYMNSVGFKLYEKGYDSVFIPKLCN